MSPLAFDKQGKPFTFDPRTEKLLVRLFRNPSARGTCCQVFDADGQPLYVDSETDHTTLRKEVGHVPGLYRLDQCDKNGDEIEDVPAAYVSIDVVRNAVAAPSGEVNPLVIIQQMAAIQADVMKTMAQQQAALMAATAEIMRAPYRPAPIVPVSELRNANAADDDHDDDEYEEDYDADDEGEEEAEPTKPFDMMMKVVAPHAPEFGKWLWKKFAEFLNEMKGTQAQPAALPVAVAMPATPAGDAASVPMGAAAGSSFVTAPVAPNEAAPVVPTGSVVVADVNASDADVDADAFDDSAVNMHDLATPAPVASATIATAMPSATTVTETAPTAAPIPSASASATTATTAAPMSATSTIAPTELPVPTPEQLEHLYAIRERLAPKERAIAERAISRMDPPLLVHWLTELSSMSVEDATTKIRGLIAQIPPRQPTQP